MEDEKKQRSAQNGEGSRTGILVFAALAVPTVIGMLGFLIDGAETFPDALYQCISMYGLNYGDDPPNAAVEIARWLAPLVTASSVALCIRRLRKRLRNWLRGRREDSVGVFGAGELKDRLLLQLGKRGVDCGDGFRRAGQYILVGSEDENLAFWRENRSRIVETKDSKNEKAAQNAEGTAEAKKTKAFMLCDSIPAQSGSDPELALFSFEESAARLYWNEAVDSKETAKSKEENLFLKYFSKNGSALRVVILGSDRLAQELYYWGVQKNIFDPAQRIEYHLFGDWDAYMAVHTQLGRISDPVIYHREPWYASMRLIQRADLVLVTEQDDQTGLIWQLLLAEPTQHYTVFTGNAESLRALGSGERVRIFDMEKRIGTAEEILRIERLTRTARRINDAYNGDNRTEWEELDAFTRYSNISTADYQPVRLMLIEREKQSEFDPENWPLRVKNLLSELEHIRWCRYHWLNNWQYGNPNNGKTKDPALRIHVDLLPYWNLPKKERDKDFTTVKTALSACREK